MALLKPAMVGSAPQGKSNIRTGGNGVSLLQLGSDYLRCGFYYYWSMGGLPAWGCSLGGAAYLNRKMTGVTSEHNPHAERGDFVFA